MTYTGNKKKPNLIKMFRRLTSFPWKLSHLKQFAGNNSMKLFMGHAEYFYSIFKILPP